MKCKVRRKNFIERLPFTKSSEIFVRPYGESE